MPNKSKTHESGPVYPASEIQKQFWMINNFHPDSPAYNIASVFRFRGPLDREAIRFSLNDIIRRHESLRASFRLADNDVVSILNLPAGVEIDERDLGGGAEGAAHGEADAIISELVNRPFRLNEYPLFRVGLIRLSENDHYFILVIHHIIIDMESHDILSRELSSLYNNYRIRGEHDVALPETIYSGYSVKQKELIAGNRYAPLAEYWKTALSGQSGYLNLPLDHPRPPVDTEQGDMLHLVLPDGLASGIRDLSKTLNINMFTLMLSVYFLLLYRFSGQTDITVGVPLTNRRDDEWKNTVGCFVNIVPIAITIAGDREFSAILRDVRRAMLGAHRNQEVPFGILVREINQKRDASYNPLFQAGFTFEHPMKLELQGVEAEPLKIRRFGSQLDIFLSMWDSGNALTASFEYNTDLFDRDSIERISSAYQKLLESVLADQAASADRLDLLTDNEEKKILADWNNTARDYDLEVCLHQLYERQAAKTPDRTALVLRDRRLTYRELDTLANRLAHRLQSMGVGSDSIVGVYMERSFEMIVSLYAILKAGGAYLPLNPELPANRIQIIADDARPVVVITQQYLEKDIKDILKPLMVLGPDFSELDGEDDGIPSSDATPDSLAYVMYTSGSTGNPKGVMITHRAICNRLIWMQEYLSLQENDRVMHKTPFSFDISVWELFWTLQNGATLVIAEPGGHRDCAYLVKTIKEQGVTLIHFVPTMLDVFLHEPDAGSCTSLRLCISAGEALSCALQERFFSIMPCSLVNLYGPTEAAVDVTAWKCERNSSRNYVPIGYPVANTQMYILNAALRPVPVGVTGDLYIGGVQLARGYLGRRDLTDEKFIPNPFSKEKGSRLYKTGDLARWHADGSIEYIGRSDFQVKLHGLRVELGEIESLLDTFPGISQAVVVLRNDAAGSNLVAYFTCKGARPEENELRDFLKQRISSAIVPSYFVALDSFPVNTSGKVDRKALPAPQVRKNPVEIEAPTNRIEEIILSVWKELLNCETIGIKENFFDAGGNSLLMSLVNQKLRELLKRDISMMDMFQYPTIASLAGYLGKDGRSEAAGQDVEQRSKKQREYFQKMKNRQE